MFDNTINKVDRLSCTGCGMCVNLCSVSAIKMEVDNDGFLKPVIDKNQCINCGQCLKRCPVKNCEYSNWAQPKCYAAAASSDEIKLKSSSGGAFSVFARNVIEKKKGFVCGAVLQDNKYEVKHEIINRLEDIKRLRGSKYVQSNIGTTFYEVKKLLKDSNYVLYTGCPCQIAGLNAYLNQKYNNLFTVEVICHGVPSKKVLKKYIEEIETEKGEIKKLTFRTKEIDPDNAWLNSHATKIEFSDGNVSLSKRNNDSYLNAFLRAVSINNSCANCKFARIPRQADITIGDFWGIDKQKPELMDSKGTSVILVNNEHGMEFLEGLKDDFTLCEEVPLELAILGNKQIIESPWVNPRRNRFYDLLDKYKFSKAVDYGINRRFEIGYVGWWYGANYGSVLTNFALHEVLTKKFNKTVLMISYPGVMNPDENTKSMRFARKHYEISQPRAIDKHDDLNWFCEKFVLGSDQLWNWYSIKDTGHFFLLDWVKDNKKKIAYATSFGHASAFFPKEERIEVAKLLNEFSYISVREKEGVEILQKDFGVLGIQLIDPVFLCEKETYDVVADEVESMSKESYIFAYILDPTEEKKQALDFLKYKLKLKAIILIDGQAGNKDELVKIMGTDNVYAEVEIEQWLRLIKDAKFVFTDSYHGTCFSIINKKTFIAVKNKKRGNSRFESLMGLLGLQERLLENSKDIMVLEEAIFKTNSINYPKVDKILNDEKIKAMDWLKEALDSKNVHINYQKILIEKIEELQAHIDQLEKSN